MRARRVALAVGLFGTFGVLAVLCPPAADAQESEASIAVEQVHPAGTGAHYIVRITTADGEPANGATVTATPTGPDRTRARP